MKKIFGENRAQGIAVRRFWLGFVGLWLIACVALAEDGSMSAVSSTVKQVCSRATSYVQGGGLRGDMAAWMVHFDNLFRPDTGAGARMDEDLEE